MSSGHTKHHLEDLHENIACMRHPGASCSQLVVATNPSHGSSRRRSHHVLVRAPFMNYPQLLSAFAGRITKRCTRSGPLIALALAYHCTDCRRRQRLGVYRRSRPLLRSMGDAQCTPERRSSRRLQPSAVPWSGALLSCAWACLTNNVHRTTTTRGEHVSLCFCGRLG